MPRRKPLYDTKDLIVPVLPCDAVLIAVAIPLVPLLIAQLELLRRVDIWHDNEDKTLGNNLLGEQIMNLINPATTMDSMYRMLDATLNGTQYTEQTANGVTTITPAIPLYIDTPVHAIVSTLNRLRSLSNVLITGDETELTPLSPTQSLGARIQQVIDAIANDTVDLSSVISELTAIAGLLA
jgi:hypothetical protein